MTSGSLNDLVSECRTVANLGSVTDGPTSEGWCLIEVSIVEWNDSGSSVIQFAIPPAGTQGWIRVKTSDSWSTWKKIF